MPVLAALAFVLATTNQGASFQSQGQALIDRAVSEIGAADKKFFAAASNCQIAKRLEHSNKQRAISLISQSWISLKPYQDLCGPALAEWLTLDPQNAITTVNDPTQLAIALAYLIPRDRGVANTILARFPAETQQKMCETILYYARYRYWATYLEFVDNIHAFDTRPLYNHIASSAYDISVALKAAAHTDYSPDYYAASIVRNAIGSSDIRQLDTLAHSIKDPNMRYNTLAFLVAQKVNTNPDYSRRLAKEVYDWWNAQPSAKKQSMLKPLIQQISVVDITESRAMLNTLDQQLNHDSERTGLLSQMDLAEYSACIDSSKSLQYFHEALAGDSDLFGRGSYSMDGILLNPQISSMLQRLMTSDPQSAATVLKDLQKQSKGTFDYTAQNMLRDAASRFPAQGEILAKELGEQWPNFFSFRRDVDAIASHPENAMQLLQRVDHEMPDEFEFFSAATKLIDALPQEELSNLQPIIASMKDPRRRMRVASYILATLTKTNPTAAQPLLDQATKDAGQIDLIDQRISCLLVLSDAILLGKKPHSDYDYWNSD